MSLPLESWTNYIVSALFAIGLLGFLVRRNALVILMCIEIMLNAVNLYWVSLGLRMHSQVGIVMVVFGITVAAAEAAIGLAIIINLYRVKGSVDVDLFNGLRG